MPGNPLDDPVREAAEEYLGNILVLKFTAEARDLTFDYLTQRSSPEYRGTDAELSGDRLRQARQNTLTFLREAERLARLSGDSAVGQRWVRAAWIKLCPGLYPFC